MAKHITAVWLVFTIMIYTCPDGHFQPEHFFEDFFKKISEFERKRFLAGVLAADFSMSIGKFWGKHFGKTINLYTFLVYNQKIFGILLKNFRQGYQNCILRNQGNILRKKIIIL